MSVDPVPAPSGRVTPLWRLILARVLVVLGVLVGVVAIVAGYVRWQVFDDDTFEKTAEELIADDAIRDQVAAALVDTLFTSVDVKAELEQQLPEDQQRFAPIAAMGIRELADRAAVRLLERPRVQQLWVASATTAQEQLERVLDDDLTAVRTEGGYVVLNLKPLVVQLGDRIAIVGNLASRLPDDAGVIRIMEAEQLETAQNATQLFKTVAAWIWVVPFLLFALAVWLARGRRRIELRAVAIGFVVAGLLVLVLRGVMGRYVVDSLATTASVEEATQNAWSIVTELLADGAWSAIIVGVVALIGVWLAGPSRTGTGARSWLAPAIARPGAAFGGAAALLLILVWWGPTDQTRRWLWLLVMAVLLAIGVEALRRVTRKEHPEAASTPMSAMAAGPRGWFGKHFG